ncbi:MAG: hypothetical protein K0U38_03810 [Epsilonproteobacteria bacterium]|nr:hypothetical protein [Campylobacterota bacterium]
MIFKIVTPIILILLTGCGSSNSTNTEAKESLGYSFKNQDLYQFKLNFVDNRVRYDMDRIDTHNYNLIPNYFDFDLENFEVDSSDRQIFVNSQRGALTDMDYKLESSGMIVTTLNSQDVFRLSIKEVKSIKTDKLEDYKSDISIEGKQYRVSIEYLSNFYKVENLVSDDTFDTLSEFTTKYRTTPFKGDLSYGLVFSENQKLLERQNNKYVEAGTYEIKEIDNDEVLFVYPDDTNRYESNGCYLLDFSRVWEAKCYLKGDHSEVHFYDKDVYDSVLNYLQTNFVDVDITI